MIYPTKTVLNRQILLITSLNISIRRGVFFRNLFSHFQYARNAREQMKKKGFDLNHLTNEQKEKLKPLYRMQSLFKVVNVVMGSMGLIAFYVYFSKKQKEKKELELTEKNYEPIWMDLKCFKHKAALIHRYLIPEQVVHKLNEIQSFQYHSDDVICASFPKSGTTLLQELVFLIENDFDYELAQKEDISQRFAFLEWPTTNLQQLTKKKRRFFKTHLPPIFFNQSVTKAKVRSLSLLDDRPLKREIPRLDHLYLSKSQRCHRFIISFSSFN